MFSQQRPGVQRDAADAALREVCAALSAWGEEDEQEPAAAAADPRLSADARAVAAYLDAEGVAVPRDLGVIPAEALRSFVCSACEASSHDVACSGSAKT